MRANTKKRKNATRMLIATQEQDWWADQIVQVMLNGKRALDTAMLGIGRLVAETLMYMEREEKSGPDYHPTSSGLRKWASQRGSIYIGDQKLAVEHPRLRGPEGEVGLRTYEQLKSRGGFSEELLGQVLRGMSARKYEETVTNAGKAFGVTPSSVSRHLVEATAKQLKQFQERRLEDFSLFAMYLDTVHRGGQAFVVALGVDGEGKKAPSGLLGGSNGEPRDLRGTVVGAGAARIETFQAGPLGHRWWRGDHQGAQRPIRQEAHPPTVYFAQRPQPPAPPAQTLPQAGTPPLLDGFGAEQLQGREEDVAGVRALASRHQRVGGGFTPRSARGSADPPQAEGSRPAAQEPAFDESYREHVLHGSELRAQYQTLP